MGIAEMWQLGFFSMLWDFSEWRLSLIFYTALIVGFVGQWFLLRLTRLRFLTSVPGILALVGVICCEIASHVIIGWDRFGVYIFYMTAICLFAGICAAFALRLAAGQKRISA